MKRKQRKSLLWGRFGYVILIIIKFGEVLLWFSPRIINALRSYIKHEEECFIRYPNTSKLVKKNLGCASFFSIHFLVFGYLMKHSSSCLIYYITGSWTVLFLFFLFFKILFVAKPWLEARLLRYRDHSVWWPQVRLAPRLSLIRTF